MKKALILLAFATALLGMAFAPRASAQSVGYINGHEYVDLGLSVKWATCNIGASNPSGYGDYFAWGETKTKLICAWDNSVTFRKKMGSIAGNPQYDAARANWGGTWRLPTVKEIDELINNCKWEWTSQGRIWGYKVTGPSGRSIFLPAAGFQSDYNQLNEGMTGDYWSATPNDNNDMCSYILCFLSDEYDRNWTGRDYGLPIRPVSK